MDDIMSRPVESSPSTWGNLHHTGTCTCMVFLSGPQVALRFDRSPLTAKQVWLLGNFPSLKTIWEKKNLMSDSSINIAAAMPSNLRSSGGLFHLPRRLPTFFLGFHWPTTGCSPPPQTRAAASEKGCVCDWRQIWKPSGLSKHVVGHFSFVVVLIPAFDILLRPAGHQTLWGLGGGVQVARSASQLAARSDVELVLSWLEQSSFILYAYEVFYLLSERNGWDPTKNKNVCHLEHI